MYIFFFSSRRRHTRWPRDWSSDVCSSDLELDAAREVARLELKLAQENVQVLQASFEEGRANLRDVEKARLEENDRWIGFLDSDYEHQKAQLDLLNTTGDLGRLFPINESLCG